MDPNSKNSGNYDENIIRSGNQANDPIQRQPLANLTNTFEDVVTRPRDKGSEVQKKETKSTTQGPSQESASRVPQLGEDVNVMVRYTVHWVNEKEGGKVYHIIIELPHPRIVIDAIKDLIPYINEKLAQDNSKVQLSTDPNQFELYKAKRTGYAKVDYPALDNNQILSQSGIRLLNLTEKEPSAIIMKDQGISETLATETSSMLGSKMIEPTMVGGGDQNVSKVDPEGPVKTTIERCCWFVPVIKKSIKALKGEKTPLVGKKHD